jgi:ribosomal protein S12 methylthiotransferase accessory factor
MVHSCYTARLMELERALGVTRVARVTGLDRSGVEVACAVRPGGHVLQVSNGKGLTWAQARASALSEAAELWAAERVPQEELVYGARKNLRHAWSAAELGSAGALIAPRLWSDETRIAWRRAREMISGEEVLVPAQAVHCPPQGAASLGPALIRWSSNGMGAHPSRRAAIRHALLEALERDQLARALPRGWTARAVRDRMIDPRTLPRVLKALVARLARAGLRAHLFDLSGSVPLAGALLIDDGPQPITAGYACGERALLGALLEAAQSRLTDIHGAREDMASGDAPGLREVCSKTKPVGDARALPRLPTRFPRAAVVDLAPRGFPLHVVKVIVPGLVVSELL